MDESESIAKRDRILKDAFGNRDILLGYASTILQNRAEAEDVVQDAFVVIAHKYEEFEEGTSTLAWTRQIVRNKAMEALRRRKREVVSEDEMLDAAVEAALESYLSDQKADDFKAKVHATEECMASLREQVAVLLDGFYWGSETCERLAKKTKRTANAVRLMLSRSRKELRECVDRKLKAMGFA